MRNDLGWALALLVPASLLAFFSAGQNWPLQAVVALAAGLAAYNLGAPHWSWATAAIVAAVPLESHLGSPLMLMAIPLAIPTLWPDEGKLANYGGVAMIAALGLPMFAIAPIAGVITLALAPLAVAGTWAILKAATIIDSKQRLAASGAICVLILGAAIFGLGEKSGRPAFFLVLALLMLAFLFALERALTENNRRILGFLMASIAAGVVGVVSVLLPIPSRPVAWIFVILAALWLPALLASFARSRASFGAALLIACASTWLILAL